jgi:Ion transport protein
MYLVYLILISASNYGYEYWVCNNRSALDGTVIVTLIFNGLFVLFELYQIVSYNPHYISDPFNYLQWITYILVFAGQSFRRTEHCDGDYRNSSNIMAIATISAYVGLLYFLRPFRNAGILVRMIISIALEVKWILFILLILVFGFSQAFYLLSFTRGNHKYADGGDSIYQSFASVVGSPNFEGNCKC